MNPERGKKGDLKMTFTIIEKSGNRYTIDVESLDELTTLAERYGWATLAVNIWEMTITIE